MAAMSEDPYKAPETDLEPGPQPERPVLGVLTGFAVDIGGTILLAMLLAIGYGILLGVQGMSEQDIQQTLSEPSMLSPYALIGTALGLAMSYLGGLTCSRVARARTLKPGITLAALTALLGGVATLGGDNALQALLLIAVGVGATLLGAGAGLRGQFTA